SSARRVPRGGPESGEFPAPDVAFFTISVDFCHILSGDDPFDPDSRFRARGRRSAAGSLLDRGAARGRSPGRPLVPGVRDRSRYSMVVLPESSAPTLLRQIHQVDSSIPIVLAAERGSVERAARAIAAGANDFLVTGEQLRERIA